MVWPDFNYPCLSMSENKIEDIFFCFLHINQNKEKTKSGLFWHKVVQRKPTHHYWTSHQIFLSIWQTHRTRLQRQEERKTGIQSCLYIETFWPQFPDIYYPISNFSGCYHFLFLWNKMPLPVFLKMIFRNHLRVIACETIL